VDLEKVTRTINVGTAIKGTGRRLRAMGFKVVKIEQVENGYVVTSPEITPLPPDWEPFFRTLEEVITYLKFSFSLMSSEVKRRRRVEMSSKGKSTRKIYDEAVAQARKVRDEAGAHAFKVEKEAVAPTWKAYEDAEHQAWKIREAALTQAFKTEEAALAQARKTYEEAEGNE